MSGAGKSDVLIVGAGVIGLSLARELNRLGAGRITLIEKSRPGRESSFAAAGMLAPQAEADSPDDFFRFCRSSAQIYPEFSAALFEETGVDIEYDDAGTLYLGFTEEDLAELARRFEWQSASGLRVEHLSGAETRKLEPFVSPDSLGSLYFPEDRQVENRKLIEALLKYCEINGIEIISEAEAKEIKEGDGTAVQVSCADGRRFAGGIAVVTSGAWSSTVRLAAGDMPSLRPIRGQMVSFSTAKRLFSKVIYSPRGYIVPRKNGRILAGSTTEDAGFDNRTTMPGIESILGTAREISPGLVNLEIKDSWSGLRPYADDGHPVIGPVRGTGQVFISAGHYRNGILLAPLTARILADLILNGRSSEYIRLFSGYGAARQQAV